MNAKKKAKVLIGICSARQYKARREAVRETWLAEKVEGIEARFFLGQGNEPIEDNADDIIELTVPDDYNSLPAKVFMFFRHALEHYDFDWLLKCDDDTYLVQKRVHSLLNAHVEFIGDISLQTRGAPSGGAGYLLSRSLVEKMAGLEKLPSQGAEDLIVGELALYKFNAPYMASHRLCIDCSRIPLSVNNTVSAHWCSPGKLREIHELYQQTEVTVYSAKHPVRPRRRHHQPFLHHRRGPRPRVRRR